ncbi:MAG TPA: aromatic amino acid lyase, partial [Steroidobacteraceae bacterium]|nr:aromatic amino acid lyase [Steroidobacteraceae bacterium]
MTPTPAPLSGLDLPLSAVAGLVPRARWRLSADALTRMQASRAAVERAVAKGQVSYGITTGFGAFAS